MRAGLGTLRSGRVRSGLGGSNTTRPVSAGRAVKKSVHVVPWPSASRDRRIVHYCMVRACACLPRLLIYTLLRLLRLIDDILVIMYVESKDLISAIIHYATWTPVNIQKKDRS